MARPTEWTILNANSLYRGLFLAGLAGLPLLGCAFTRVLEIGELPTVMCEFTDVATDGASLQLRCAAPSYHQEYWLSVTTATAFSDCYRMIDHGDVCTGGQLQSLSSPSKSFAPVPRSSTAQDTIAKDCESVPFVWASFLAEHGNQKVVIVDCRAARKAFFEPPRRERGTYQWWAIPIQLIGGSIVRLIVVATIPIWIWFAGL